LLVTREPRWKVAHHRTDALRLAESSPASPGLFAQPDRPLARRDPEV